MQQTNDGGYILGGFSNSSISGDKTENCIGGYDYWIVKLDSSGGIQWQNTIGGNETDIIYSIQQTTDGGFICGGNSNSDISGDKTENSNGLDDYWIVKIDSSGNIQWQNTIGGSNYDNLRCIRQSNDGGYICGGSSHSGISGDKTENNVGSGDYWVVKLDSIGNIQWQNSIGGNLDEELTSIQATIDGGYICGGASRSSASGDKTENSLGQWDYWILKLDSLGNIIWQNTIGGDSLDNLNSVQQTNDGGYILGGFSNSGISGDKTENSYGHYDYWLVKVDSLGNIMWQRTIGGNAYDDLFTVQQTLDSGFLCGGYSASSISGNKTEYSSGNGDFWIVKLNFSGNIEWQNSIGGSMNDLLYSLYQTADGNYISSGVSGSNISGDKAENSLGGGWDFWVVKLTDNYNLITGKLFIDANNNNVQDMGEPDIINKQVTEINTSRFSFSQQNGFYSTSVLDSGNFSVSPVSINYYNTVPTTHSAYFLGIQQTDSLNDFAFQPTGVFNDLCVTITPLGPLRAGFNASYMINYENVGTTTINNCSVIFFRDNDVMYVSSNVTPFSITTDSVIWNIGTVAPFQTGNILVTVNVNVGTPVGTLINSGVRIEPVAGDANPACNYSYWEVHITGPVDPNAILVDKDTVITIQLTNAPYLEYIIYFQNIGNDTAFNVKVLNPIDTFKLQLNTLEFVASSHPVNMSWIPWERNMEFKFDNILLPDSNVNEPASHGFVRYRVKPKTTLVAGDEILNTAFIYFDFNAPVQTNTAVTEIVQFTGLGELAGGSGSGQLAIYPNPAKETVTIETSRLENGLNSLKLFDLFGREVYEKILVSGSKTQEIKLNVSNFSEGVYIVQLSTAENIYRTKLVKE